MGRAYAVMLTSKPVDWIANSSASHNHCSVPPGLQVNGSAEMDTLDGPSR